MSKVERLRNAAQVAADKLEAWAEAHESIAKTALPGSAQESRNANRATNYRVLVELLRDAIADSKL